MFVCLFVLTGYTLQVFGVCCKEDRVEQVQHAKKAPKQKSPNTTHSCQCICHQVLPEPGNVVVRAAAASLVSSQELVIGNQFPPDSLPLGIDYPPQLS